MKAIKIFFYVALVLSVIQLCLYLFSPFSGALGIINTIKNGIFSIITENRLVISLDSVRFEKNVTAQRLQFLNSTFAFLYFTFLLLSCLSPLMLKLKKEKRYLFTILFSFLAIFIVTTGSYLFKYLVKIFLGIY
jgi:hypothetical protein